MKKRLLLHLALLLFLGALSGLPTAVGNIPLLCFICHIPYALYLKTSICGHKASLGRAYLAGLSYFMGYFAVSFSFFIAMYPLDFAGLSDAASVAVLFAAMVLLPLFQAAPLALSALFMCQMAKSRVFRIPALFSIFFAASASLLFYLQNFTWAGVPWAPPVIGLASSPVFIQTASLFGSSFLTFFIFLINALVAEGYDAFRHCLDKRAALSVLAALLLFLGNSGIGALLLQRNTADSRSVKVALIQGCAPISEFYTQASHLNSCRYLAKRAAAQSPDIMLWSETALERSLEKDSASKLLFSSIAEETGAIQIIGAFSSPENEDAYYNALFVFYPDGSLSEEVYHKRRPVPFGEYLPMAELFKIILPALTEINMLSRDIDPGRDSALFHLPDFTAGGLICFDSIYPALARDSVKDGADILLIPTNDSWFDGSFGKTLHCSHAVLRAVENGRPVARTGNTGLSVLINEKGEIIASAIPDQSDEITGVLSLSSSDTLYTATGDVFMLLCFAVLIFCPMIFAVYDKIKQRKDLL